MSYFFVFIAIAVVIIIIVVITSNIGYIATISLSLVILLVLLAILPICQSISIVDTIVRHQRYSASLILSLRESLQSQLSPMKQHTDRLRSQSPRGSSLCDPLIQSTVGHGYEVTLGLFYCVCLTCISVGRNLQEITIHSALQLLVITKIALSQSVCDQLKTCVLVAICCTNVPPTFYHLLQNYPDDVHS